MNMRADLNAALDSVADGDSDQNYEETPQEVLDETNTDTSTSAGENSTGSETESNTPTLGSESDAGKSSGASTKSADGPAVDGQTGEKSVPAEKSEGDGVSEKPDTRSLKAPIDWSPKEREDWSKIPPNLQAKIKEREQHIQDTMQESSGARATSDQFNRIADNYSSVLSGAGLGNNPMEAMETLFKTAASLRMGTANDKAQTIANLMKQFDVDVMALDGVLTGQPQADTEDARLNRLLDERMGPLNRQLDSFRQQEATQQTALKTEAANEVMAFAENAEFLNDVREDMADMIQAAGARGVHMTMEDAYKKSCAIHPQISNVLAQRATQERITGGNQNMAAKKAAASSIHGTRTGVNAGGSNQTLRESISAAWDGQHD